ncbi:NAD(P)-dependent alcohol dehydrogenase [Rhodobacteraceae bacterium RKSG542]|uniref:NAD(P)-dependent alcohol dehydrogenase n=1 Tax=Pseudovibrio flavus TaxID=2529854 RepID=UPI0012BC4896|nr:NAD(P)-dependent alcohol dehydrogenase [Pseudovibrio flavus]MTI19069.1 NAD(P)-dependent alcohol dehydrogenase [Pseudovibrio flavus]
MKAMIYERYGAPEVLHMADVANPKIGENDLLVKVAASSVSTADWRMRASAFPGGLWLVGRMFVGLFRPKNKVLGTDFSGTVEAVGDNVTDFTAGDRVFGFCGDGGNAEYLRIDAGKAVAHMPEGLGFGDAAAVPFGGLCALTFLRDYIKLKKGERILIVGASGGVGAYAVQIAVAMGAEATGVCSASNTEMVLGLGAKAVLAYDKGAFSQDAGKFDVVFDCVGVTSYSTAAPMLKAGGRYAPLNFGLCALITALGVNLLTKRRMVINVNPDRKSDLEALAAMIASGTLKPVVDRSFPLEQLVEAHRYVERRHKSGSVVISVAP